MKIKGILFDKDGTLIDFFSVWGTAAIQVTEKLCQKRGILQRQGELLKALGVKDRRADSEGALAWKSYNGIAEELAPLLVTESEPDGPDPGQLSGEISRLFFEEVAEKRTEYPVFTDVRAMMAALDRQGIRIGLATSDEQNSARKCMEILGADKYISFWGTAGTELPEKPDGRLIRLAAEEWGLHPEEIAVVGDTPNDMRFAAAGGAFAVAVLSGTGTGKELGPLADEVITSVAELEELLMRKNREEEQHGSY